MGELAKKLHYIKTGGSEETIALYDSTTDCPSPYLSFTVDGANAYAKLGDTSDENASAIRVYRNSDGKTYAVLKIAQTGPSVTVKITQSSNQTIHVYTPQKNGGTDHTSSFTIASGTTYEAEVVADSGYTAGTLVNASSGTLIEDTSFSASEATEGSNTFTITVGKKNAYLGYSVRSNGWGYGVFGSSDVNLPNGFTLKALFWNLTTNLCYVTISPQLSQYISTIVFGDNEVAVTDFTVKSSTQGGLYSASLSDSAAKWLANNAGEGKTVQVVIYANEL